MASEKVHDTICSHRVALRSVSNNSPKAPLPPGTPDQNLSPRETPRLHLRSSSSRFPSDLWFDKTSLASRQLARQSHGSSLFDTQLQANDMGGNWEVVREEEQKRVEAEACSLPIEDQGLQNEARSVPEQKLSQPPTYSPCYNQVVPRHRCLPNLQSQPHIQIHGLRLPIDSAPGLFTPVFHASYNNTHAKSSNVQHLDTCTSWNQMSMATAELLFLCQDCLVSTIEGEVQVQVQLQHIMEWYYSVRSICTTMEHIEPFDSTANSTTEHFIPFGKTADSGMEHIIIFDMLTVINKTAEKILGNPDYANRYVDIELIRAHIVLCIDALNCIDWVEKDGKAYGSMAICLDPLKDHRDWISPVTSPIFMKVIQTQDTLSFGNNTTFAVREGNEILISPEYRRQGCRLPCERFEIGNEIPWLSWDPDLAVFKGTVPIAHNPKPTGAGLLDTYPEHFFGNLSIVIKATLFEQHPTAEVRLKRVIRTRLNLDVYPWWYMDGSPSEYASFRNTRLRPGVLPLHTAQVQKALKKKKRHSSKPLEALFQASSSLDAVLREQKEGFNTFPRVQEKSPSLRKVSFEEHVESFNSITAPAQKALKKENGHTSKPLKALLQAPASFDAVLKEHGEGFNTFSRVQQISPSPRQLSFEEGKEPFTVIKKGTLRVHSSQPSSRWSSNSSLPHRFRTSTASTPQRLASSTGLADAISLPDYASTEASATDPLDRSISEFVVSPDPPSLPTPFNALIGGRFAPLLDLESRSASASTSRSGSSGGFELIHELLGSVVSLDQQSRSSGEFELVHEPLGSVVSLDEQSEAKADADDDSRDGNLVDTAALQPLPDSSNSSMRSYARPPSQPEDADEHLSKIQGYRKRLLFSCFEGDTPVSGTSLGVLHDEWPSSRVGRKGCLNDGTENEQHEQSKITHKIAPKPSLFKFNASVSEKPANPQATNHEALDEEFSGYESGYDHDMFVPQPRSMGKCRRKSISKDRGSTRQKKAHKRVPSSWEWSPSKRQC